LLIVQHLLYQTKQVKGQTADAGIITLEQKDYNLDEVVIKGERPLVKVENGRLGYDLSALSEKQSVNNAYEAIIKLPGKKWNSFSCRSKFSHNSDERQAYHYDL
jgi:hypothetical protein